MGTLFLTATKVTDAGLKELAAPGGLTARSLQGTGVTDAGLKELAPLKGLTFIALKDAKVTNGGVKELRKALPKCRIIQ